MSEAIGDRCSWPYCDSLTVHGCQGCVREADDWPRTQPVPPTLRDMQRCVIVFFDILDPPGRASLYGAASASDLLPVLRALIARLEHGTLRMPIGPGAMWVEVED